MKRFLLLVSLSSRPVELERCSLNFLTQRYRPPSRLAQLPPFRELKALHDGHTSYRGALIAYQLSLDGEQTRLSELTHWNAARKLQHAAVVGSRLVLCYEDQLAVYPDWKKVLAQPSPTSIEPSWIDDPWFAGLHTVFDEDGRNCIVSSSAADAVLRVDLERRAVVSRWRLPAALYGTNYALGPADSLREHYVHNDLQLGHLNCASPGRDGSTWVSTLIQGDIGRFAADGSYRRVASGFVGAHGVREERGAAAIYFADSCLGTIVRMSEEGRVIARHAVDSRWLHDVQQVEGDLFIFAASDRNALILEDLACARTLLRQELTDDLGYVQFLNLIDYPMP